jgi:hypothetical protein
VKGAFEKRPEGVEFFAIVEQECVDALRICRAEAGDGILHSAHVGCGKQFSAAAENEPVMRIEADEI